MGIQALERLKFIGLDSNIFSYQFHQNPVFGPITKKIFDLLSSNKLQATTSFITLIEILSVKTSPSKIKGLQELFLSTPNLTVSEINLEISLEAARIRRRYSFRSPDAIQLATAISLKTKAFISNDEKLKRFKQLKVILLREIKS